MYDVTVIVVAIAAVPSTVSIAIILLECTINAMIIKMNDIFASLTWVNLILLILGSSMYITPIMSSVTAPVCNSLCNVNAPTGIPTL
ncbi:hypothetical protein HRbin04_01272 [archaeon HR04]|nr:hypothetical protein HRbin04_01272 [archaeon HR04]